MISRYANYVHIEKFFHMPMAAVRMRMGPCIGGGTNAMKAFESAEANLAQERSERKVVFFICDGQTYDCRSKIKEMKNDGIEVYPLMIGRDGCKAAHKGGYWDLPETVKIPNPSQNLASTVVDRLCNTIR